MAEKLHLAITATQRAHSDGPSRRWSCLSALASFITARCRHGP